MPTYGYRCTSCGHEFERFQKMTDAPVTACEECGAPVKKMIYPVGIAFKGTGFYVTDYKDSSGKPKAKDAGDNASGESGAKSDGAVTESAKAEGAKTESAKSEGGSEKTETKNETKTETPKPASSPADK